MLRSLMGLLPWAITILYGVVCESMDTRARLQSIETDWPRTWKLLNNRVARLVLLIVAIGFLARDFSDAVAIGPPPRAVKVIAPPPPPIAEPPPVDPVNSLRNRTGAFVEEYTDWITKIQKNEPLVLSGMSAVPPEERKKEMQSYQAYCQRADDYYSAHFKPRFIRIIKEYDSKGVIVGSLMNDFAQPLPFPVNPQPRSRLEGMDAISRFGDLAYHVDAKDHLIVL